MTEHAPVELEEDLYCIGCGAKIQTTDPVKPGYTPMSALKKRT